MNFKKLISSGLCLLAAIIWGCAFAAQKAGESVPVFLLVTCRSWIAAVFLFGLATVFDRMTKNGRHLISKAGVDITRAEWIGGVACGAVLAVATAFQQYGISGADGILISLGLEPQGASDAGKAAFITALYVVLVPILELFLRKKAPLHVWISVGTAAVGFWLLCITDGFRLQFSDFLLLICAGIYALHILVIGHFSPGTDGVRLSAVQFLTAGTLSAILFLCFERSAGFGSLRDNLFPILYLGICSSGIGYTAQIVAQKNVSAPVASVLLSLESVFGVLSGALFLRETMSVREWIGCAVVFAAVLLAQMEFPRKTVNPPPTRPRKRRRNNR